jgi:MFS family permease
LANTVQERGKKQADPEDLAGQEAPARGFWQIFFLQAFLVPTLVLFLVGLLFGGLVTFLPLYIREEQLNISAGMFYTYAAIASFLGRIVCGKASDVYGRGIFVTASLISYILCMLILASIPTETEMIIAAILEGLGGGILIPLLIALISDRSLRQERGKAYAICLGGFDLGMAISGPILGIINLNYNTMFFLAAGFGVIALAIFLTAANRTFASSFKFACGFGKDNYRLE